MPIIFEALEKNNQNTGGAYIEKGPTVLYIRSEGLTASLDDIGKIVVKTLNNGMPVLVRDVAKVQLGSAIRYGAMTYNDKGEVAGAVVMMLKGENSSVVVERVKQKIAEIQKDLPEGVVVEPFLDRTKMVNSAIETVETNLLEGALIVVFVLVFFLGNLRAGLIVSSVIPLAMLFAIILMNMFGVGGNLMSLGAIDFGLIVDGSVIVVEAVLHRFSHSHHFKKLSSISQEQMDEEVSKSTGSIINSAVFSQIIILIVYLPILSLEGIEGKMFKPMALTIAFAILGAFLLSITYVPMMNALFLNKKLNHKATLADKVTTWIERRYMPLLKRLLKFPKTIIVATLALFAVAILILGRLGGEFIPQIEEGDFAVETRLLTGSNLNNTIKYTQQASHILLNKFPEVEKVVTKIGSAEIPTDPMPFEAGDMMVILKPKKEWTSAASFPELSEKMTKELSAVPGITVGFQFPVQMRFNELMTGARQDVVCKIFGEDLDSLSVYAHRLNEIIQTVPGAINIYEETVTGMPQIVIKFNRDALAKYGLNVDDINNTVNTAFAGKSAGQVYEGEKRFDLVVRLNEDAKKNIDDIRNLMISTKSGYQIPVSEVAEIKEVEGVNQIQREDTKRRIVIGFNVTGRDVQTIVAELQQKAEKLLKLPAGYRLVYGGSFENMNAAKDRLAVVVPVALLMIFLLLYFAFNSVKQGLLIYTAIPLSAMGGIFALWIRDMPFSISAGVGFIALFGVAVLNGILLVSEFNRLKKEGWTDLRRIVVHATKTKLRAVLMTALVPSLGFIPMAISTGAGGAVQKPLATVVIGGLIISTLLTLFVLPVLYIIFEKGFKYLKPKPVLIVSVCLFLLNNQVNAQEKIGLDELLKKASTNFPALNAARLNESYLNALIATAVDIPKTDLVYEAGHLNGSFNDNRFLLSQSFQFPTVYSRQKDVNRSMLNAGRAQTAIQLLDLQTEIKNLYFNLLILEQKKAVLLKADSIYARFAEKAENRYRLGETDIIEKTTASNHRLQIAAQLKVLLADQTSLQKRMQMLVQYKETIALDATALIYPIDPKLLVAPSVAQNPAILWQQEMVKQGQLNQRLEKSKLLPSLNLGYANASFMGWQNTPSGQEVYYSRSHRFQSFSAGIALPLFFGAQNAKAKAMGIYVQQQQKELEALQLNYNAELEKALTKAKAYQETLASYHQQLLPNAAKIEKSASAKLDAGDINYLDWTILINQSIEIKSQYYQLINHLNETLIEIERLNGIIK